jgi:hypothetical protein
MGFDAVKAGRRTTHVEMPWLHNIATFVGWYGDIRKKKSWWMYITRTKKMKMEKIKDEDVTWIESG